MKKIIVLILILATYFFSVSEAKAQTNSTTCVWRPWPGNACQADETKEDSSKCPSATRPEAKILSGGQAGGQPESAGCCCKNQAYTSPTAATPKFTIPELQIPLPTLKLSEATCVNRGDGTSQCQIPWISEYILAVYNYGLSIAGILAAIMLMAGGALWLVSGGDVSKITQAKELIVGSITGVVILFSSYIILMEINPDLTKFYPITIGTIKKMELEAAKARNSNTAEQYKDASCPTDVELAAGVNFYATGYYKPTWEDSDNFRCIVAMQCSCPNNDQDKTKNCDQLYGQTYPGYHPCNPFPSTTAYCDKTKNGSAPQDGDIAGPSNCSNLSLNSQVCFNGKTYTITDAGGGIKGRRIDIWSGTSLQKALSVTGVGVLKKGSCN